MRIGVDARALKGPPCGISTYTRGILDALARRDDDHEYYLYSPRGVDFKCGGKFVERTASGLLARKGSIWAQTGLIDAALADRVHVFFGPLQILPVRLPRRIPAVLAVHDLVHMMYPGSMSVTNFLVLRTLLPPSVRRADAVITGSNYTRDLIRERLGACGKDIRVIYHGLPPAIGTRTRDESRKFMEEAYAITGPYVLFVGVVEPRKNIETLLKAFEILKYRHGRKKLKLVVAGTQGWKSGYLRRMADGLGVSDDVVFTGSVRSGDLAMIYAAAEAFAYPSLYEGFGFPPLEAMASGVPVVMSSASSLPEIAGCAAIAVPPKDPGWMALQILRVLANPVLRDELVRLGRRRAAEFSWESAAQKTMDMFLDVARRRAGPAKPRGS